MEDYFEDWREVFSDLEDKKFSDMFGEAFQIQSPMRAQVFRFAAKH